MMFSPISGELPGSEIANDFLSAVHCGAASGEQIASWLAELRDEGLSYLAEAIERRLRDDVG